MARKYDVVCIGGGSAGMLVAQSSPHIGAKAAVVEKHRIGGDCLWTGCVPSKALIASARAAWTVRNAADHGIRVDGFEIDTEAVWKRIRGIQQQIADSDDNADEFRKLGTDVYFGEARVSGPHSVQVGEESLDTHYVLIATGSRPSKLDLPGLEEAGYLTSENVFELERLPESMVVIGGGPIGVELSQCFNRLGRKVTILERSERILVRDEPELSKILSRRLTDEGVEIVTMATLDRVASDRGVKTIVGSVGGEERRWQAAEIFAGAGRTPNLEGLGLEEAGVKTNKRGVVVDKRLRSSVPSIYAAGDIAGRYLFTHSAGTEAVRALRNMFYPFWKNAPDLVPWTTFTDPELAHVGMTSAQAKEKYGNKAVAWRHDLNHSDRARAEGEAEGAAIVITGPGKKIVGAHILAPAAGEMIGEMTLAMSKGASLTPDLANMIHVYPTISTGFSQLAAEATYDNLKSGLNKFARKLSWLG